MPSTYNKDLQEDKERLFDTIDTIKDLLKVNIILLENLKINKEDMKTAIDPLSFATELADYLTEQKMPFREAHNIVGKIVLDCIENQIYLTSLTEDLLKKYNNKFKGIGNKWSNIDLFLKKRDIIGGTGSKSVKHQISTAKKILGSL